MSGLDLQLQVFSYNRGRFLENCIASIEACLPYASVCIVDDNSDDEETRTVLKRLARRHRVISPSADEGTRSKHGGLYANMQTAFEGLPGDALMGLLQDDMQVVRPVEASELASVADHFRDNPRAGFVQPAFFKGEQRRRRAMEIRFDETSGFYYADRHRRSAGAWYSDICLARVDNLRRVGWHFMSRESRNEQQARQHFSQMAWMKNPFAAWLPCPSAWRGKQSTLALRIGEHRHGCGFHPLWIMDNKETREFLDRDPAILPFAEDFLSLRHGRLPRPWVYHPLQGSRWLKWLNSAEFKLRQRG